MCHSKDEWTVRKIRIDTSRMTRHGRKCGKDGCAESAPAERPGEVSGEGARGGMAMDVRGPGHHGLDRRKERTCLHRQCGHPPDPRRTCGRCLGRHLHITLVVSCVKYRPWSACGDIMLTKRTRTHDASDHTQLEDVGQGERHREGHEAHMGGRREGGGRVLGRSA